MAKPFYRTTEATAIGFGFCDSVITFGAKKSGTLRDSEALLFILSFEMSNNLIPIKYNLDDSVIEFPLTFAVSPRPTVQYEPNPRDMFEHIRIQCGRCVDRLLVHCVDSIKRVVVCRE